MVYTTLNSLLTAIADVIRSKKGTTAKINAQNFPSEIEGIPTTYTISIYNGGHGNNFLNIELNSDNTKKKVITGDLRNSDTYDVKGSNDKITWNAIAYADLTNITYKFIKINKIISDKTDSYLTIEQT